MVSSRPQIYDLWSFSNLYRTLALLGVSFLPFAVSVQALAPPRPELPAQAADIERRQEQELEHQRARAEERPDVLSPQVSDGIGQPLRLASETPCFTLSAVTWEGEQPPVALLRATQTVTGQCVGAQGLRTLHTYLMGKLERVRMPAITPYRRPLIGCVHKSLCGHKFEAPNTTAILGSFTSRVYTVKIGRLPLNRNPMPQLFVQPAHEITLTGFF